MMERLCLDAIDEQLFDGLNDNSPRKQLTMKSKFHEHSIHQVESVMWLAANMYLKSKIE